MNFVAFGVILICYHAWANKNGDNFLVRGIHMKQRTSIEDFLENKVKNILQNGDSSLGIPVLDPFTADKLFLLSNVNVTGLSAFDVNDANFIPITLFNLDLSWPLITASANYSIKRNNNTEIKGKGGIDVAVHDFRYQIVINFKIDEHIQIKEITEMYIGLEALDFCVTGLFKDAKKNAKLSKMISNMVPKLIDENQDEIVDIGIKVITKIFNKLLSNVVKEPKENGGGTERKEDRGRRAGSKGSACEQGVYHSGQK